MGRTAATMRRLRDPLIPAVCVYTFPLTLLGLQNFPPEPWKVVIVFLDLGSRAVGLTHRAISMFKGTHAPISHLLDRSAPSIQCHILT